jgi:hypothetical protein
MCIQAEAGGRHSCANWFVTMWPYIVIVFPPLLPTFLDNLFKVLKSSTFPLFCQLITLLLVSLRHRSHWKGISVPSAYRLASLPITTHIFFYYNQTACSILKYPLHALASVPPCLLESIVWAVLFLELPGGFFFFFLSFWKDCPYQHINMLYFFLS